MRIHRAMLSVLLVSLAGCAAPAQVEPVLTRYEFSQPHMGTMFRIVLYAAEEPAAKAAADAGFARIEQLNSILSDYDRASELSRLSDSAGKGEWVKVSDDLWRVLRVCDDYARRSDGAFDITVGPVVQLWRWARRNRQMPSVDRLATALKAVGYEKIEFDEKAQSVRLTTPGMRLDAGAIGKGYACEEALKIVKRAGFSRAMVDCGSSTIVGDAPPGKEGWRIGIASLEPGDVPPSKYVVLTNAGVFTSGDAWQYVELDGKRYSHIVDPKTGLGLTDHSSVTVIAPAGTIPDGLSTTISVLGPQKGLEFVEKLDGVAAFIVRKPGERVEVYESKRVKDLKIEAAKE